MADEYDIPVKVVDRRRWRDDGEANPDSAPQAPLKPTYVEELEQRAAQAEKQAQEYLAKYREAAHEFYKAHDYEHTGVRLTKVFTDSAGSRRESESGRSTTNRST